MKTLMKIIGFLGGLLLIAKLFQLGIDYLYDNCGKCYITSEDCNNSEY